MRSRFRVPASVLKFQCSVAFTIIEVLVATTVLSLMIVLIAQLFSSATSVITLGNKRMETDVEARALLDRMAIDFGRMIQRADVDYFVKSPTDAMTGDNDQIAFYAEVPGYYPSSGSQSPVSLVAFRMNASKLCLERLGKGLLWSGGATASNTAMVFLPLTIKGEWPAATNQNSDSNYEVFSSQIFRFEYGYVVKGQTLPDGTMLPSIYSTTPWDTRAGVAHTSIRGFQDVSAIVVSIAMIDSKSRVPVSDTSLSALAASMADFDPSQYPNPGDLEKQWQSKIDGSGLPKSVTSGICIYRRTFSLTR